MNIVSSSTSGLGNKTKFIGNPWIFSNPSIKATANSMAHAFFYYFSTGKYTLGCPRSIFRQRNFHEISILNILLFEQSHPYFVFITNHFPGQFGHQGFIHVCHFFNAQSSLWFRTTNGILAFKKAPPFVFFLLSPPEIAIQCIKFWTNLVWGNERWSLIRREGWCHRRNESGSTSLWQGFLLLALKTLFNFLNNLFTRCFLIFT